MKRNFFSSLYKYKGHEIRVSCEEKRGPDGDIYWRVSIKKDGELKKHEPGSKPFDTPALAVAEECGADGARLLTGFISAWERMIRLGLAAPGAYQANGFQISAAGGAIGAAVAAAAIRGLAEDQAVSAIGIAGSQASGLLEFLSDGSTVKALHPGWAAHTGIAAIALAEAGMTGPETVLEGRFGFLAFGSRARSRAPMIDLYRKKVFSTRACRW